MRLAKFTLALLFVCTIVPTTAFALLPGDDPGQPGDNSIQNPLACDNCDSIAGLLFAVAKEVAKIGFYVVVIFIIYSGFLFVKARGNEKELEVAKKAFLYTVVGGAILLGATILATVIEGTVNELRADKTTTTSIHSA